MTLPNTPVHSRNPSNIDFPNSVPPSPANRRQSRSSFQDPSTSLRNSFSHQDGMDMSVFTTGGAGHDLGGIGNLADELADALSGSGEDENDEYYEDGAPPDISFDLEATDGREGIDGVGDSGVDIASPRGQLETRNKQEGLSLPPPNARGHRRAGSEYDGSEYGSDSDLDSPGMTPSLVAKIDAVEHLARRGTESTGGHSDEVFKRVSDNLRDLGSQSGVEGSTTRLITAHSALTTHLTHQTRQLHNLTFPLLNPLAPPPDAEMIEELLPGLIALSNNIPRPATAAYNSLTALHSITSDLVQTLNYLSDTLHMSRQTTITATRRLKSAKELVSELRKEEDLREEGELWLTRGNWSEKLKKRECARVCGEVVGGFEEVCNTWRARLQAQAESA